MPDTSLPIDGSRVDEDLTELSRIAHPDESGWTRTVFSEPYRQSREFIRSRMEQAGLEVRVDEAGNVVGTLPGQYPSAPALMTGSHTDTVRGGGRFDGAVGVLGGIELARALRESETRLRRDLIVVDFLGEEPNDFSLSCLGSRALAGGLTGDHMSRTDHSGVSLAQRYHEFGLDPAFVLQANWARARRIHRYIELHIEQGPVLETNHAAVGVVTAIAGIERLLARFTGRADHAGTMPMSDRRDALVAAAEAVLAIRREGCGAPVHGVATTSQVDSVPGSPNVVPADVSLAAELRSIDPDWLSGAKSRLASQIAQEAQQYGVDVNLDWRHDNDYVPAADSVQDAVTEAAKKLGLQWEAMPSGATHDAVHLAQLCPMGMIFVPSQDGRSHCPEEFTAIDEILPGIHTLGTTLRILDAG